VSAIVLEQNVAKWKPNQTTFWRHSGTSWIKKAIYLCIWRCSLA